MSASKKKPDQESTEPDVAKATEDRVPTRDDAETGRAMARQRLHAIVGSLLALFVCLEVNYLAFRHFHRFDWTSDDRFTLSERTHEELARLDQNIDVFIILSEAEPAFADLHELLQRYRADSTLLTVTHVDPDLQAAELRRVAERFDLEVGMASTGEAIADVAIVIASGDRHWKITRDDLFSLDVDDLEGNAAPMVDVKSERALTGGIVQVLRGDATHVCLTTGRGEWGPSGERPNYLLREEFERENIVLEMLPAVGLAAIPDSCDAVFVLGPQRGFSIDEARVLIEWVRAGGDVLLALDPILEREAVEPSGFEDVLSELGISLDPDVVLELDPRLLLRRDPSDLFRIATLGDHVTTRAARIRGGSFGVNLVRSVRADEGSTAIPLLLTSDAAFGEMDLGAMIRDADLEAGPEDLPGPLSIAVAAEAPTPGAEPGDRPGRIVVLGDSDWLEPGLLLDGQFSNIDLLMAWTGWLTERDALIAIPPRRANLQAVVMSEADVAGVRWRVFGMLPGAVLLLGFAVWWSRRQ